MGQSLLLLLSALLAGAAAQTSSQLLRLRMDQQAPIAPGVSARLIGVHDSRCPINARCMWAGTVDVTVQEKISGAHPEDHVIGQGKNVTLGNGIAVQLLNVTPEPGSKSEIVRSDYVATFMVYVPETAADAKLNKKAPGQAEWEQAFAKWKAAGSPTDYLYTYQRSCFCMEDYRREARVTVANGEVVSAAYTDDGAVVASEVLEGVPTVLELFFHIKQLLGRMDYELRVTYDKTLGYPTHVFSELKGTADGEFDVTMSKLQVTSPAASRR